MLAYAAHRRSARRARPATLLLIVGGHALLLAAVMAIRMEVLGPPGVTRTTIVDVPLEAPPPPPNTRTPQPRPKPTVSSIDMPKTQIEIPLPTGPLVIPLSKPVELSNDVGKAIEVTPVKPVVMDPPLPAIVRTAPRLLTGGERLRPPYPEAKRRSGEEATLRLRLAIGADGRVTSVDPVGPADPDFLAAARMHLLRAWRFAPAREGDRAAASTIVVSLRFQLED